MISKNDCLLLLTELNATDKIKELVLLSEPTIDMIKFINDNRELELTRFYTKIRKNYNNKKSKLYINIVKEIEEPTEVLTTLSGLLTQILIHANSLEDRAMFLRHSRANEIAAMLYKYFESYDITNCIKLLRLIKADIKTCEMFYKSNQEKLKNM